MITPGMRQLGSIASLFLLGVACSDSTSPSGPPRVGLTAGTVSSADGQATLDVPAGALAQNIVITIAPAADVPANMLLVSGTAYDLTPNGTQFNKPPTLTVTYNPAKLPAGTNVGSLAIYHLVNNAWRQVTGSTVDTTSHTVKALITSFSDYSIQATSSIRKSFAAGDAFTCALNDVGSAFCWGGGPQGQLGDGTTSNATAPVAVAGGHRYRAISAAGETACGLLDDGTAECWGLVPTALSHFDTIPQPEPVPGAISFSSISVGLDFSCGIATAGGAYCWGVNDFDQLGLGTPTTTYDSTVHTTPTAVVSGGQFVAVSSNALSACALDASGASFCWGDNGFGELGIGQTDSMQISHPVAVTGGLTFRSISSGGAYTCGITTAGATECWGNNSSGQLGDGTGMFRSAPTPVAGSPTFAAVFAGSANSILLNTCALDESGAASCWGLNDNGQLGAISSGSCGFGRANYPCSLQPLPVQGGLSFGTLASGFEHTCGMTADRTVYCWGSNEFGQLGNGTTTNSGTPVLSSFSPLAIVGARQAPRRPVADSRAARPRTRLLVRQR